MSKYTLATVPRDSEGWIKVTDLLPVEGDSVFIHNNYGRYVAYYDEPEWYTIHDEVFYAKPSHWQPLPGVPDEFKK